MVVLPAPLGPNRARKPPRGTANDTSWSTSRRPKVLPSPMALIAATAARGGAPDGAAPGAALDCVAPGGIDLGAGHRAPPLHGVLVALERLIEGGLDAAVRGRRHPLALRPQRHAAGGHEQHDASPDEAHQREDVELQAQVRAGGVERVLYDHEEVARQAAQDDGAQRGAVDGVDVGVRRELADHAAAARHDEVGEGPLRVLRPGVLREAREAQGVAGHPGGGAGLGRQVGAALDHVEVRADQADQEDDHPQVGHPGGAARAIGGRARGAGR